MKKLSIIFLIMMISLTSCAINKEKEMAKESGSSTFQPEPLDDEWNNWLIGEWVCRAESDVGAGKGRTKIEFGLNGQFLIYKGEGEITDTTLEQRQYLKETLHTSDEDIEKFPGSTFKKL